MWFLCINVTVCIIKYKPQYGNFTLLCTNLEKQLQNLKLVQSGALSLTTYEMMNSNGVPQNEGQTSFSFTNKPTCPLFPVIQSEHQNKRMKHRWRKFQLELYSIFADIFKNVQPTVGWKIAEIAPVSLTAVTPLSNLICPMLNYYHKFNCQ